MLGAIIGDIVGSRFEWNNIKTKDFELLNHKCNFTDDSVMSFAVASALLKSNCKKKKLEELTISEMRRLGSLYPNAGYGGMFTKWLTSKNPKPYNSYGNGSAMRVSACGFVADNIKEAKELSRIVTGVTHNHKEGYKGAEAIAVAIVLAKSGKSIIEIRDYINDNYYPMNFKLDDIREEYEFDVTCQGSVPQAIEAFLESTSFEDAIRNAISIGGDSDTIAAITGGIAEAYYGIPNDIRQHALTFLPEELLQILIEFENKYPPYITKKKALDIKEKRKTNNKANSKGNREEKMKSAVQTEINDTKNEISDEQTNLNNYLYECCNILRGPINQDEFKTYILPILFLKRISDVYDEETEEAKKEYGDDYKEFDNDEIHKFVIPEGYHWEDIRSTTENVGSMIADSMTRLEAANPNTLSGLFSSFDDANWADKNKLSDERLINLVEHLSSKKVGNKNYSADVMGDAYEYLLKKFADMQKKNAGEFYTPRTIVKLLVMILDPKPGDTIYDPACGTGGMLIESIKHLNNIKSSYGKIFGQEKNLATSAIGRMNLFLHGAQDFNITQGDTLKNPNYLEHNKLKKFNCVIANPPFGLKKWGASVFESDKYGRNIWGTPSDSNADFAWIQHMVKSMDDNDGRCAVIMPQGVLFHTGYESKMREQLVKSDLVECIITLVGGLFFNAGVNACILVMNKSKEEKHKHKILFIDATKIFTPKRAQNIMSESDINKVFEIYKSYEDRVEESRIVDYTQIETNQYDLSPTKYIEKKPAEKIDYKKIKKDYYDALQSVIEAEEELHKLLLKEGYIDE